jgi:acyl carrier protein
MTDNHQEIESALRKFIVDELFVDISEEDLKSDMSLRDEIGVDSIGFVELISFVKNRFNTNILGEDQRVTHLRNIDAIVKAIEDANKVEQ